VAKSILDFTSRFVNSNTYCLAKADDLSSDGFSTGCAGLSCVSNGWRIRSTYIESGSQESGFADSWLRYDGIPLLNYDCYTVVKLFFFFFFPI